jgi:hypothetical protein
VDAISYFQLENKRTTLDVDYKMLPFGVRVVDRPHEEAHHALWTGLWSVEIVAVTLSFRWINKRTMRDVDCRMIPLVVKIAE